MLDANNVTKDSGGDCTETKSEGPTKNAATGADVGRSVCYVDNGTAFEWWTNNDLRTLSLAVDTSGDLKALDARWQQNAGPY